MKQLLVASVSALVLASCASVEAERGLEAVVRETAPTLGATARWQRSPEERLQAREEALALLAKPLTADSAVAIALLQKPGLQAAYAEMGVAASERTQASRLPNPGFSFARLVRGDVTEIERRVSLNILGLLVQPIVSDIEERRFERSQLVAAGEVLRSAADVRRAYYDAVAARQVVKFLGEVSELASARAELAGRLRAVGNWSLLNYAREQVFYAEAAAQRGRAEVSAMVARERLVRLMGLWGPTADIRLPDRLPDLPNRPQEPLDIEKAAVTNRLDVRMARAEILGLAKALGLSRATRFVNVVEVSYLHSRETGEAVQRGYEIDIEIPLFDWGDAKVARAEFSYMAAAERLADLAVDVRSQAREAYLFYRAAYDLARHYRDEVVPIRQRIAEESALRYNGMIGSVFELLAEQREQVMAVSSAIEAQRDYWMAATDLEFITLAAPSGNRPMARSANAAAGLAPAH